MPDLHHILIELMEKLEYKKEIKGVCYGYAEKSIDAFLIGEY